MRDMSDDYTLRTAPGVGNATPPIEGGGLRRGDVPGVNPMAELLADLLAATGLVPEDKLAMALVDEGVATQGGIARTLASRYQLPLIDLTETGVDVEAAAQVPIHVLE